MRMFIVMLLFPVLTQAITWTTKTQIPQVRSGAGCAVINDTVYIIGGSDGSLQNTNYVYDPVSDSWSTKASMPTARSNIGCAVVNGKIYAIGGFVGGAQTDTNLVEEYDPTTDSWSSKAPMPTSRYAYTIAVVANKIYVIGGILPLVAAVEEYDPALDSWSTKASMPTARMAPACAVIRDTIFVFGGSTSVGSGATTVHECYDPNTDNWASKANMTYNRYALGGFSCGNMAYAVGGYNYTVYRNNVEVYNPVTNSWSDETAMQYARQSTTVGLVGTAVYVIGGWNNGALNYNEEGIITIGIEEQEAAQNIRIDIGPNPFSKQTYIKFQTLPTSGRESSQGGTNPKSQVTMGIYDVTGRLVKSFGKFTNHPSLINQIVWDGRDDNGTILPSGTYLFLINNQGVKETRILNFIH